MDLKQDLTKLYAVVILDSINLFMRLPTIKLDQSAKESEDYCKRQHRNLTITLPYVQIFRQHSNIDWKFNVINDVNKEHKTLFYIGLLNVNCIIQTVKGKMSVPLSPESQKKELCIYLQLMNPADIKQVTILQNRRSTRLRNLEKTSTKLEYNDYVEFPPVPQRFSTEIDDFENTMEVLYGVECRAKQKNSWNNRSEAVLINSNKISLMKKREKKILIRRSSVDSVKLCKTPIKRSPITIKQNKVNREPNLTNNSDDSDDVIYLSEEHKKCIYKSHLLTANNTPTQDDSLSELLPCHGFSSGSPCVKYVCNNDNNSDENLKTGTTTPDQNSLELLTHIDNHFNQNYFFINYTENNRNSTCSVNSNIPSKSTKLSPIEKPSAVQKCIQFNGNSDVIKSLHRNLCNTKRKRDNSMENGSPAAHSWVPDSPASDQKHKKVQHCINISHEHGRVLCAYYVDFNLVICQESHVSFWSQTALGNVLGAQNMWIPKGHIERLVLDAECSKSAMATDPVIAMDNSVAYVELWMKEHRSELRQVPVADIFATVYFWKQGLNRIDKKVLQLENINGFVENLQYLVLSYVPKVIVAWHSLYNNDNNTEKTYIHCYDLATDYQTVINIHELPSVDYFISSLHIIEDCDGLIMGSGNNKITLWNTIYGYAVATVELTEILPAPRTRWVKCDRGFLFVVQEIDEELRLIAINGINHKWKKLASYFPPKGYNKLKGVCVENGLVSAFYAQGVLCWNAQTSDQVIEEIQSDTTNYILSKNYVITLNEKVAVKHFINYLLSSDDS